MNRARLEQWRDIMARVSIDHFDFRKFFAGALSDSGKVVGDDASLDDLMACGTKACAVGWWALSPEGREAGWGAGRFGLLTHPGGDTITRTDALAATFGIPTVLADDLMYEGLLYEAFAQGEPLHPRHVVAALNAILDEKVSVGFGNAALTLFDRQSYLDSDS